MKKLLSTLIIVLFSVLLFAQPWMKLLPKDKQQNPDFYSLRDAFNRYWKPFHVKDGYYYLNGKKIKAAGWNQFHRWEYLMETRVDKTGFVPVGIIRKELLKVISNKRQNKSTANWTSLGPFQVPVDLGGSSPRGNGRINTVAFHPTNPNIFWVGSPSGGVWKTIDGGNSWTGVSDNWAVMGISDIAVNPNYPDTVYAATGDADAADTWSIGILISADGGLTWNPTGLSTNITDNFTFRKLAINPDNPSILLAASNYGMYRTTDAGVTWNATMTSTNFKDVELMPGNPQVVYATSKSDGYIYKSTDGGINFSDITPSALNPSEVARIEIAVTPDNPSVLVALCANSSDNGFHSIWKSSDSGSSWTKLTDASTINLLGWETDGSDSGGQGWYDLSLAVDPQDENTFFVGGVNIWKTSDNGNNWTQVAHWYGGGGAAYVHADQHILRFNPLNNNLFSGNDGGIYYSTNLGTSWIDVSSGITVLQIYRMGTAQTDPNISVTGAQDNGSMKRNGTTWNSILGGDGMDCLVDYTDENIMFAEYYYGNIYKSIDGGYTMNPVNLSQGGNGAWITPYIIDWNNHNTLYAGFDEVYKTTDGGSSWNTISSGLTGGTNLQNMAIAPSNSNYLYVSTYDNIWRTTNGGGSWTDITTGLPNEAITSIAVSDTDPLKIWVSFSGYSVGEKVYKSTDGGNSWVNFSDGLPDLPANCIVYENGSNDALYAGTDVGVYYRNVTMSQWQQYSNGLPNVIVNDLEIQYSSGKLRAATYGRGMWESSLFQEAVNAPVADFAYNTNNVCNGTIDFQDQSTGVPDTWHWDFGDSNTSTQQNPLHTYAALGTYTVTEIASNIYGSDTTIQTVTLTSQPVSAQFSPNQLEFCSSPAIVDFTNNSTNASSYDWNFGDSNSSQLENPTHTFAADGNYTVLLTASSLLCGTDTETVIISVDPSNVITASMPNNTSNSLTCCHGTLYDDGGQFSNYADNNTALVTIAPANATQITLDFASFDYELNYDYLYIYEGPDDSYPLFGSYTGSSLPNGGTIVINSSAVTIKHSSDPYVNGTGFEISWSCLTVGEEMLNEGVDFEVYPNPNTGQFYVNFTKVSKEVHLKIVDMSGKIIFEKKINHPDEVSFENLPDGLYDLILMTDTHLYNKKIIVVKK